MAFPASRIVTVASGTVMDPDAWFNTLQDGVIALCVGTKSFLGIVMDGTGGAASTPTARQLEATGGALLLKSTSGTQVLGGNLSVAAGSASVTNGGLVTAISSVSSVNANDTGWSVTSGSTNYLIVKANGTIAGMVFYAGLNTTDATVTTIYTLAIPTNRAVLTKVSTVAKKSDSSEMAVYEEVSGFRNAAGTVTAVTGAPSVKTTLEDDAAWGAQGWIISGTDALLKVTGKAGTSINWMTRIEVIFAG